MSRITIDTDESLLNEAMLVSERQTPAEVVENALEELVRVARLKRGIQAMRDTPDLYPLKYLAEIRPNSNSAYELRRALYEGREPEPETPSGNRSR